MSHPSPGTRRVLGMDGIILGYLLGIVLIIWAGGAYINHEYLIDTPVAETLWVAVYLTAVVAYCGFKMPIFAAGSAFWSTFLLIVFCGHISLFFDSFAVVLLLATGITFTGGSRYNQFVVKVAAAFTALTVGGGFYLGELWGLPYYISSGLDNWKAGFPLLIVLTPYSLIIAAIVARCCPVTMQPTKLDSTQIQAAIEFTLALLLIIVTHSPFLCLGVLLVYTAIRKKTIHLVQQMAHEIQDGAQNALGLILLAVIIQAAGWAPFIQPLLEGVGLFIGAFISSPFAGAMVAPAANLAEFYQNISIIMLGAPFFVFSSLVAIVVFTQSLDFEDLPRSVRNIVSWIPGIRGKNQVQEGIVYTILVIPMLIGLAIPTYAAVSTGLFVQVADWLQVTQTVTYGSH